MKKLTAGILTVLLGIVSANSADAAVASKGYVDQKIEKGTYSDTNYLNGVTGFAAADKALDAAIKTNATDIAGKANKATTLAGYDISDAYTKTQTDALLNAKQNAFELGDNLIWGSDGKLTTSGIATNESFNTLQADVNTLKADANTAGSVAKQIADAVAAETSARETADAGLQKEIDAINNESTGILSLAKTYAKDYADGLADNYATAAQGALAATALQKADVTSGSANGTISVDGTDVAVTGLGSAAYTASTAYDAAGSAATAKTEAITAAKTETETQISNLSLGDLSRVPAKCSDETNYCVLTTNGTKYLWEVIERASDETQPVGTDIPPVKTAVAQ